LILNPASLILEDPASMLEPSPLAVKIW